METIPLLATVAEHVDWDSLHFTGEAEVRAEVAKNERLRQEIHPWTDLRAALGQYGLSALAAGMLVGPHHCPAIYRLGIQLQRILRLRQSIEIVVFNFGRWFVDLTPSTRHDTIRIAVSSLALQTLWTREALFVLGRKLGRILLNHTPLVVDPTLGRRRLDKPGLLLRGLWRFQELGCDRVGLLCCQDLDIAARAILKASSGLPDDLLHLDLEKLLEDRIPEDEAMIDESEHEFNLLRIAALRHFVSSEKYRAILPGLEGAPASPEAEILPIREERPREPSRAPLPVQTIGAQMAQRSVGKPMAVGGRPAPSDVTNVVDRGPTPPRPSGRPVAVVPAPIQDVFVTTTSLESYGSDHIASGGESLPTIAGVEVSTQQLLVSADDRRTTETERVVDEAFRGLAEPIDPVRQAGNEATNDAKPAQRPRVPKSLEESARTFTVHGALWMAWLKGEVSTQDWEVLAELFGNEVIDPIRHLQPVGGEAVFERVCTAEAERLREGDLETRLTILREILGVAMVNHHFGPAEMRLLYRLGELLGLGDEQTAPLTAEYVDPEFAEFPFQVGQEIEVLWDGSWTRGRVHEVNAGGDLRVRFEGGDEEYRLSSRADIIRPLPRSRAG